MGWFNHPTRLSPTQLSPNVTLYTASEHIKRPREFGRRGVVNVTKKTISGQQLKKLVPSSCHSSNSTLLYRGEMWPPGTHFFGGRHLIYRGWKRTPLYNDCNYGPHLVYSAMFSLRSMKLTTGRPVETRGFRHRGFQWHCGGNGRALPGVNWCRLSCLRLVEQWKKIRLWIEWRQKTPCQVHSSVHHCFA